MVSFDSFVSKAYELAPPGMGSKGDSTKVGLLGDRVVKVGFFNRRKVDVAETKRQFVESALAQFGPGVDKAKMREAIEKMVEGGSKTPLSARMIISVSEFVGENTSTINRLASILNRAAVNDFKMVSLSDIGKISDSLESTKGVQDVKSKQNKLKKLQRKAELAMTQVFSYTGRQIGEAMAGKGDQAVHDNIEKAVKSLLKIGSLLHMIDREATKDIPGLAEIRDLAYSRATELNRIANELGALCEDEAPAKDKEEMLNATAARLMAGASLEMHGTEQALSHIEQNLRPLLDRVDAIKSGVSDGVISWDTTELLKGLTAAKDAFENAARNGIDVSPDKSGKEVFRPNPTLLAEVGRLLDKAIADVTAVAQDQAKVVVMSAVQEICPDLKSTSLMRNFPSLADGLPGSFQVKMLFPLMDVVRASAAAYVESPTDSTFNALSRAVDMVTSHCEANDGHLYAFLQEVELRAENEPATGPNKAQRKALNDFLATSFGSGLDNFYLMMKNLPDRCKALCNMANGAPQAASLKNDGLLKLALEGRIDIPTLTGARGWGATEDMVDVNISDANLVETKPLGHGAFNQVYLCKYRQPDGTMKSYVFKSEISGEQGFSYSCGMREGYSQLQSIVHLNAATRKVGEILGTPELCVDAKVGCLNGRFGLFMEVAPGQSVHDMLDKPGEDYGDAAKDKVGALPAEQKTVLRGKMMRATVDLAWNDWLSGQGDRHAGNFLFNVGGDQSFTLKGVDNDMSFSTWRLGMTKFRLVGRHLETFLDQLADQGLVSTDPVTADDLRAAGGAGVVDIAADGNSVTIDLSLKPSLAEAVRKATGFQSLHKPLCISLSMYQRLKQLEADPSQLDRILGPHVPREAIEVTKLRLKEMIAHADMLAARKRVLSDEEWMSESFQRKYAFEGNLIPAGTNVPGAESWAYCSTYANSLGDYYKNQLGFAAAPSAPHSL